MSVADIVRLIIIGIFILICIALTVIVLMQEGKSAGLSGAINGVADTYWGKNKGRSIEGKLVKFTKFLAIGFIVLAAVLNIKF
ncbi:preprotein translocase subunit SecG [[Clostridium] fimetarium]|uniref:Protein-export membrane protein SecG n=1 Tax=[Clostridium] fimetarium TaxID=99656 RepID=A0A1I0PXQ5_9FIRM|nr:preprotein translocase subunit SecG [[Clostridium] fimetarium]SEW19250.1 preprotein translocase subunit SecG [[Clostridium] fimetarium]